MRKVTAVVMMLLLLSGFIFLFAGCAPDYSFDIRPAASAQSLTVRDGGDFRIITVTDSHLNGKKSYEFLAKSLDNLVTKFLPDLVVFNGDNVDTANDLKYLQKIGEYFESKKLYWALVLGNHDRDPEKNGIPVGLRQQNALLSSLNRFNKEGGYCLYTDSEYGYADQLNYQKYDLEGNDWHIEKHGNYAVQIERNGETVYSLVFMDSGQHRAPYSADNGYIERYQVDWYKAYMQALAEEKYGEFNRTEGRYIPSMVFLHQPVPEYRDAAKYALNGAESGVIPEVFGFGVNRSGLSGMMQKEGVNNGLFAAMKAVGGTHIFCGHIHSNNSSILYEDIWVSFLNRVGRRSKEQKEWPDERVNFSKMITIKNSGEVELSFAFPDGHSGSFLNQSF